jgi:hypothetical protein
MVLRYQSRTLRYRNQLPIWQNTVPSQWTSTEQKKSLSTKKLKKLSLGTHVFTDKNQFTLYSSVYRTLQ